MSRLARERGAKKRSGESRCSPPRERVSSNGHAARMEPAERADSAEARTLQLIRLRWTRAGKEGNALLASNGLSAAPSGAAPSPVARPAPDMWSRDTLRVSSIGNARDTACSTVSGREKHRCNSSTRMGVIPARCAAISSRCLDRTLLSLKHKVSRAGRARTRASSASQRAGSSRPRTVKTVVDAAVAAAQRLDTSDSEAEASAVSVPPARPTI
mmetsp:Transcript_7961/g.31431  ORF Transcript_7961/g.31431 Transcript_7961/m.31431 type:complete len:214 (+) Transcript_7961:1800-2441(+)